MRTFVRCDCVSLLLISLLAGASMVASAQPSDESQRDDGADAAARTIYLQAEAAYDEGRYENALRLFQEAYRLSERPVLLYNIANTFERLGRLRDAVDALQQFLPSASPSLAPRVERRIESLLARSERRALEPDRQPDASLSPRDDEALALASEPAMGPDSHSEALEPEAADGASGDFIWAPILLFGVALAGGGVALGLSVAANDASESAMALCTDVPGTGLLCPASAESDVSAAAALSLAADIAFGVAAASALAAITWLVVSVATSSDEDRAVVLRLGPVSSVSGVF